jgi:hypothetical protein
MIRLAARTLKHFVLTILVIVGGFCALEVGLRFARVVSVDDAARTDSQNIAVPSRNMYLTVPPGLRVRSRSSPKSRPHTVRTNSFGLRNAEIEVPRDPALFRILCLGDETTLAPDLPEPTTYARVLQRELEDRSSTGVEVLNAGCPGACPTIEALQLRHHLLVLQPDVILVHLDTSDLADEDEIRRHVERSPTGMPTAATHPALAGKTGVACQLDEQFLVVRKIRESLFDAWKSGHAGTSRASNDDPQESLSPVSGDPVENIRQSLVSIRRMADSQSAVLIVTTTEGSEASASRRRRNTRRPSNWPPQSLADACAREKILLIDASAQVREADRDSAGARRLSAAAHAEYARVIAGEILRQFAGDSESNRHRVSDGERPESQER